MSEPKEDIKRILIVEDEMKLGQAIADGLSAEGFIAEYSVSGEEALFALSRAKFDLLVLDIMLPGRSGIEILKIFRKDGNETPVILLTAKDQIEDKVEGFSAGADDYLVKPFAFAELLARVRALLKRAKPEIALKIEAGRIRMDLLTREVRLAGDRLDLTLKEFDLLEYLLRHQSEVVSREMLARDVWRETSRITPLDNVIDVHMARLRKKLEERGGHQPIETVRGVGFIFRDEGQ